MAGLSVAGWRAPDHNGARGYGDCVPHTWRIDIPQVLTGNPGIDEYAAHFAGRWILTRRRAIPDSSVQRCVFVSQPIDARTFEAQSPYGSLKIGSPVESISLWQLAFDRESSQGSAVVEGFTGRWGLSAGFYIWTEQQYSLTSETTDVLPGTNCAIGGGDSKGDRSIFPQVWEMWRAVCGSNTSRRVARSQPPRHGSQQSTPHGSA